ncbi:MAG TPA: lamin tail domain-containing protein [Spongiibacteraceae bacterium]|nr:lamin tail domain-containing protein [Spongiibacteraceae bacterium]
MKITTRSKSLAAAIIAATFFGPLLSSAEAATANVRITEWMYKNEGSPGEFIEFTNLGSVAVDLTGWSYADSSAKAGDVSLSAFGTVAAGESVILTEASASAFRTAWNLSASVKIIGGNSKDNLGNGDAINLYDSSKTLVDSLVYGSSPLTDGKSGRPGSAAALGGQNPAQWALSSVGDIEGSYASIGGDIGSPGKTSFVSAPSAVPLPAALPMFLSGFGLLGLGGLRRKNSAK